MSTVVDGTRVTGFNEVALAKGMKDREEKKKGGRRTKKTAALMERRKTRRMY